MDSQRVHIIGEKVALQQPSLRLARVMKLGGRRAMFMDAGWGVYLNAPDNHFAYVNVTIALATGVFVNDYLLKQVA